MISHIKIRSVTGVGIKTHIPSIAGIRTEVLKEYPYQYETTLEQETLYLNQLLVCQDAIAVLVFDGNTLVGASIGLPLEDSPEEFQTPFLAHHLNPSGYFLFGDSTLLSAYRGRGIGHHFFDLREAHAKHLKRYHHSCFCTILPQKNDPNQPKDYISLEGFWKKRGYVIHPELQAYVLRKQLDQEGKTLKTLTFWTKELSVPYSLDSNEPKKASCCI